MAELNFDATKHTPQQAEEAPQVLPRVWDTPPKDAAADYHAAFKLEYQAWLEECAQHRDKITAATANWRAAVKRAHEAKMYALDMRVELNEIKSAQLRPAPIKIW